jgi:hypothetical protein
MVKNVQAQSKSENRCVTPYFSQKNKTLGTIYLNKQLCLCIHVATYFIVLLSALVFYFASRSRSKFKF